MKGNKDPEYKKYRNRFLLGLFLAIVFSLLMIVIIYRMYGFTKNVQNDISKNNTYVIYLYSKDCKNCKEIESILNKNSTDYQKINSKSSTADDLYKEYNITSTDEIESGILYFQKGKMYSNLFNINDLEELQNFIDYYKLAK